MRIMMFHLSGFDPKPPEDLKPYYYDYYYDYYHDYDDDDYEISGCSWVCL